MLFDIIESDLGPVIFSRDDTGINRIQFLNCNKPLPKDDTWRQTDRDPLLKEAGKQLKAYFSGKLSEFELPLSMAGTEFRLKVWRTLITIPYGTTWSYKELAVAIGNPAACRAVGGANSKNILSIIVP